MRLIIRALLYKKPLRLSDLARDNFSKLYVLATLREKKNIIQ